MATTIRALSLFPGIVSVLITEAKSLKNQDTPIIEAQDAIFESAVSKISNIDTKSVFYAMQKLAATTDITPINGAKSLLDQMIYTLATQVTNDVIRFVGYVSADLPEPSCENSIFSYKEKASRTYAKPINETPISDELRDQLSGANIVPGEGDNDCGDACKI